MGANQLVCRGERRGVVSDPGTDSIPFPAQAALAHLPVTAQGPIDHTRLRLQAPGRNR